MRRWLGGVAAVPLVAGALLAGVQWHGQARPALDISPAAVGMASGSLPAYAPFGRHLTFTAHAAPVSEGRSLAPRPAPPPAPAIAVGSYQQILINGDRAAARLGPLSWSSCLVAIAVANARRMAAQGYISHTNGAWLDLGCHLGAQGGENVGWWSGGVTDVRLNAMFMASADHRANIMGPYHYVATAWAVAANGYAYIAVEFA